jgi:hypothetical protein
MNNQIEIIDKPVEPIEKLEGILIDGKTGQVIEFNMPTEVIISTEITAADLNNQYSHLKKINPDSTKEFTELKDAIAVVGKASKKIEQDGKALRDPFNALSKLIKKTADETCAPIDILHQQLKKEMDRAKSIIADREAAEKAVWAENVEILRNLATKSITLPIVELAAFLVTMEAMQLEESDYGDLLTDAEHFRSRAIQNAEDSLARDKERARLAKEAAELAAEKTAFERESGHSEALAMNETFDLKAEIKNQKRLAELQAAETKAKELLQNEQEPETADEAIMMDIIAPDRKTLADFVVMNRQRVNGPGVETEDPRDFVTAADVERKTAFEQEQINIVEKSDKDFAAAMGLPGGRGSNKTPLSTAEFLEGADLIEAEAAANEASLSEFEDDNENWEVELEQLLKFKNALLNVANDAPDLVDPGYRKARNNVVNIIKKSCEHLQLVMDGDIV